MAKRLQPTICPKCGNAHGQDIQILWAEKEYITCYKCMHRITKNQKAGKEARQAALMRHDSNEGDETW